MTQAEDSELVKNIIEGDNSVFKEVVQRYQDRLFDLAMRMTGNRQDAEDIVQTAFIRIYEKLGNYDPDHKFSNWAYTITLNIARNFLRRKSLIKFFSLDHWFHSGNGQEPKTADIPDREQPPDDELGSKELLSALETAIRRLSPNLSAVFILYHFHKDSVADIAQKLGISANSANVRLFRARKMLYRKLEDRLPNKYSEQERAAGGNVYER